MYSTAFGVALNCTLCSVPNYNFSLHLFSTVLPLYIFAVWTKKVRKCSSVQWWAAQRAEQCAKWRKMHLGWKIDALLLQCLPQWVAIFSEGVFLIFEPYYFYKIKMKYSIYSSNKTGKTPSCSLKTREKYTNWDNLVCLSLYIFWAQSHLY